MKLFNHYMLGLLAACLLVMPGAAKQIVLGPPDPGAELGGRWYSGTNGVACRLVDDTDPNTGNSDFTLENTTAGKENLADWRSLNFALGPAAAGKALITFSFCSKLPGTVNAGDNIRVELRFFDKTGTNYLGERKILVGSSSGDENMTTYRRVTIDNIRAPVRAVTADIRVNVNLFEPWTSGIGRFDDFSVTTAKPFRLLKIAIPVAALLGIAATVVILLHFRSRKQL